MTTNGVGLNANLIDFEAGSHAELQTGYESADSGEDDIEQTSPIETKARLGTHERTLNDFIKTHKATDQNDDPQATRQQEESDRIVLKAREYQQELFERAKEANVIAVLDTGTGKTLIAAMLIRHVLEQQVVEVELGRASRFIFFLCHSVPLVRQQAKFLASNVSASVIALYGDGKDDLWRRLNWDKILVENQVVVCTAEILYQSLFHRYVAIDQISLLIFDEGKLLPAMFHEHRLTTCTAHNAKKDHPFSRIIRDYYVRSREPKPRLFSMTASPVDSKSNIQKVVEDLESLLHSKIVTTSDTSLLAYAHKPVDEAWQFDRLGFNPGTQLYQDLLRIRTLLPEVKGDFDYAFKASIELGAWFTDQLLRYLVGTSTQDSADLIAKFERSKVYTNMANLEDRQQSIQELNALADKVHHHMFLPLQTRMPEMSSKVQQLYRKLSEYFRKDPQTRAMVFVEQRWTAVLLRDAFRLLNIPGLRPAVLTGSGHSGREVITAKKQEEVISHFRSGLVNVLFTTSVGEEGLDIPQCNLVVRFNLYLKTIQYIQSRGRARMKNSVYAHMIEDGNFDAKALMDFVIEDAEYLKLFCQSLPPDRLLGRGTKLAQLLAKDAGNPSFQTASGAICNFTNCLLILSRYASSLHHVGAMTTEVYEEIRTNDVPDGLFQYIVRLPPNEQSTLKGVKGEAQQNKVLARRSAAYKCVCRLRAESLLDDNLDSIFKKVKPENLNARLAVSEKQDSYDMMVKPSFWNKDLGANPTKLFATTIDVVPKQPLKRRLAPLVLLSRLPLPDFPSFPLYLEESVEAEVVSMRMIQEYAISEQELELATCYTLNAVFNDTFNKVYAKDPTQVGYWLVPRNDCLKGMTKTLSSLVDFDAMQASLSDRLKWSIGMDSKVWCNKFLVDPLSGKYHYFCQDLMPGAGPFDPEPAEYLPHEGKKAKASSIIYFTDSHWSLAQKDFLAKTWDRDQPVFKAEVKAVRRNFLDRPTAKEMARSFCYIAPEPLQIGRLSPEAASTVLAWPAILHRFESYLIALEATESIGLKGLPAELALEAFTKDDSADDHETQTHDGNLRGMGKNYERLEFIGDSLLKMTSTIAVYNRTTCDEEGMHCRRMEVLCNRTLYNTATGSLQLPLYIRSRGFARDTWYPENMILLQGRGVKKEPEPVKHGLKEHQLGMKTIADVCEATIGACVVASGGLPVADRFDLGIRAITRLVESEDHDIESWSDFARMHKPARWQLDKEDPQANFLARTISSKIGYTFNYPRVIRSAFTHSSDMLAPVPDLQRLEFLGDAVLDYVCIWWLFSTNPTRNPQWLTEHKMAMVSNKFLAALAVTLDFDQIFHVRTSKLAADVFTYATEVREARSDPSCPIDFWTRIKSKPPKALSDLVESTLGAILIDSNFDYTHIENFFWAHVHPFFTDIGKYDGFANRHPTSYVYKKLTDEYGCTDFKVLSTEAEEGRIETVITAGLVVHNTTLSWSQGESARYAKVRASQQALEKLEGMSREEFRRKFACDCARGTRLAEEGVVVDGVLNGVVADKETVKKDEDVIGDSENFEQPRVRRAVDEDVTS